MAARKLSGRMISPGEAWMNFVNSKEGHNAAAVTPEYLKPVDKAKKIEEAAFANERISKLKEMSNQTKIDQLRGKTINKNLPSR